jgi:hypothetical protein
LGHEHCFAVERVKPDRLLEPQDIQRGVLPSSQSNGGTGLEVFEPSWLGRGRGTLTHPLSGDTRSVSYSATAIECGVAAGARVITIRDVTATRAREGDAA